MPSPSIPPNIIAFWLGFLAATLFWLIVNRLRPQVPRLRSAAQVRISAMRRRMQDRIDDALRHETIKRAQAMHLGAPLFALDEILIPPALLAPPPAFINPGSAAPDTITNQVVPYLPDWPELASAYPVTKLSLADALQNNVPIAVIGQPGCGKTVALADLASKVARHDPAAGVFTDHTPAFLSIFDLPYQDGSPDPLDGIIMSLARFTPGFTQSRLPSFLSQEVKTGALLLLIDDVDVLPEEMLASAINYLSRLRAAYPRITCAISAAPHQIAAVSRAGFLPLSVAAWNHRQIDEFFTQWGRQWQTHITPALERQSNSKGVDQRLLANWLYGENSQQTPLEWTLRVWGANSGDLSGSNNQDAIEAYICRCTQNNPPTQALSLLAAEYLAQAQPTLTFHHLDGFLSKTKFTPGNNVQPEAGKADKKRGLLNSRTKNGETRLTGVGQILQSLLDRGLLVEHAGEEIHFAHPVIAGYLAASAVPFETQASLFGTPTWILQVTTAHYLAAQVQEIATLDEALSRDTAPFYPALLTAARWLKDAPAKAGWRMQLLRRLLALAGDESLSISQRGRLTAAFLTSGDPGIVALYKQFLTAPSQSLRQLVALSSGALRSPQLIGNLINLLGDPAPDVRCSACLALAALDDPHAREAVIGAMHNGDEIVQLAVAETLAGGSREDQETLKEALVSDHLMARRAAVLALATVREPWAHVLLEKAAIEDGQWAVRNAAAMALESQQKHADFSPVNLPAPDSSPWLIAFAGKKGMGVATDRPPTELLIDALDNGTSEERLGALIYLRNMHDRPTPARVFELARGEQNILREAALYSLWLMHPTWNGQSSG